MSSVEVYPGDLPSQELNDRLNATPKIYTIPRTLFLKPTKITSAKFKTSFTPVKLTGKLDSILPNLDAELASRARADIEKLH